MEEEILKLENVSKRYKEKGALKNCNLSINKGRIYGVVGPNGAGKTTLFKLILSLITPSDGKIYIDGNENTAKSERKFGALIEAPYINMNMTAYQNMRYMQILNGKNDKEKINEVLELVGLADVKNKKAKKFSLGMKQRLGIAMTLVNDPDVLILDEPMNGLDPEGMIEIRNMLLKINENNGVSIMISSHILAELDKLVTDYIFIKDGEILLENSRDNIQEDIKKRNIKNFEEYYMSVMKNE